MAINNSSLRNSIYLELKSLLTAAALEYYNDSNVSVVGVTISGMYRDESKLLPMVVINNTDIAKDTPSFDRSNLTNNIQIMLDVYTKKTKNMDYIIDQIDNISGLKSIAGLMFVAWDETQAFDTPNDNKLHLKTITLTYKRR